MRRLARWLLPPVLLCAGYALWVGLTGRGPACPIHAALGLWCPLCGASRMGLALLRLDLPGALRANAVLLALLLPGTIWGAVHAVRYVRTGDGSVRRWERALLWGAVGVLLVGGVLRNLPAFAFWRRIERLCSRPKGFCFLCGLIAFPGDRSHAIV